LRGSPRELCRVERARVLALLRQAIFLWVGKPWHAYQKVNRYIERAKARWLARSTSVPQFDEITSGQTGLVRWPAGSEGVAIRIEVWRPLLARMREMTG